MTSSDALLKYMHALLKYIHALLKCMCHFWDEQRAAMSKLADVLADVRCTVWHEFSQYFPFIKAHNVSNKF